MRGRLLVAFLLGTALGAAALWHVTGPRELAFPHAQAGPETVRVLVAKEQLSYGQPLLPKHLQWVEWPKDDVPPGSFTDVKALLGAKGKAVRTVVRTIEPGEPILESTITRPDESPRMAMNLGEGRRAVPLDIGAVRGVSGFVAPGDRVDIMLIRTIEGQLVSRIIMQDVEVIAVDRRASTEPDGPPDHGTVTVEVSIVEAQKLALARQVGSLSLTLRGVGEGTEGDLPPMGADELNEFLAPDVRERCERPWSKYREIPRNILIPNLCRTSLDGLIGPAPSPSRGPVRFMRGDFGVPRGLCERPPGAPPADSAWCTDPPPR